jgi:hypothetical protein
MDADKTVEPARRDADSEALGAFLDLLALDADAHPSRLMGLGVGMRNRIQSLVDVANVDIHARLPDDNE